MPAAARRGTVGPMETASDGLPTRFGGRYELRGLLGRGGMSRVHRAADLRLGRDVALKLLEPGVADRPDARARLRREARALAALNDPRIVRVLDMGEEGGLPYLVMELVEGEGLAERLRAGPLPAPLAARMGADVAGALALAHGRGIVHRDVKPQNLMLTPEGGVKVLDFGIARPIEGGTTVTQAGMAVGTLGYIAPEVLAGRPAGAAADAYALGATLHHALTGAAPGPGGPDRALALPPELRGVVNDLLAPEPEGRPSAEEAEARLRAAAEGPTRVLAPAEGRTRPLVERAPGRRWVPWAAVAAVGAGVIAAVLILVGGSGSPPASTTPLTTPAPATTVLATPRTPARTVTAPPTTVLATPTPAADRDDPRAGGKPGKGLGREKEPKPAKGPKRERD